MRAAHSTVVLQGKMDQKGEVTKKKKIKCKMRNR